MFGAGGLVAIVSLFSGAGGLDLGFSEAGFRVAFATDISAAAVQTHQRNFPKTKSVAANLVELQPEGIVNLLDGVLKRGESIGVIGGPPCQGFSRANVNQSPDDPRNQLPLLYLDVVNALQDEYDVQFVLFENVLGIRDAKHSIAFKRILAKLEAMGLHAGVDEHSALDYGIAQTRHRVIISAFKSSRAKELFTPVQVVKTSKDLTVRSVIGELPEPAFFARDLLRDDIPHHPNHWTMRPLSAKFSNPDAVQSSGRSFRRLRWDKPSPTVAYGHREIHVHPKGHRRLSVYEAMLLQGFPSSFVLEGSLSAQIEQVSNAVPPPLAKALADAVTDALRKARKAPSKRIA